jgi:hypothetical protein
MSRSPASMSAALFFRENQSVPVKKLPIRSDGATGISSGCAAAQAVGVPIRPASRAGRDD